MTKFVYTATGRKLRTIHYTAPKNIHVETGNDYDGIESHYLTVDSTDYMLGGILLYKNAKPSQLLFDGGYIRMTYPNSPLVFDPTDITYPRIDSLRVVPDSIRITQNPIIRTLIRNTHIVDMPPVLTRLPDIIFEYYFLNKDHLGNVREVIDDRRQVLSYINKLAQGTFKLDSKSYLYLAKKTDANGFSSTYTSSLLEGINPENVVSVFIDDNYSIGQGKHLPVSEKRRGAKISLLF